jgi:uncharacterized protein (TIGR02996 family)
VISYQDHPDYLALLAAVRANPADDLPRLVLADWLRENGQPERADFIEVQCEIARLRPARPLAEVLVDPRNGDRITQVEVSGCLAGNPRGVVVGAVVDWTARHVAPMTGAEWRGVGEVAVTSQDSHGLTVHIRPLGGVDGHWEAREREIALRRRERELWGDGKAARGWCGVTLQNVGLHLDPPPADRQYPILTVRRGFIHTVRCRLADWIGDECGRCGGEGNLYYDEPPADEDEPCPDCSGTGSTRPIGPRVCAEHPVERVVLTDQSPDIVYIHDRSERRIWRRWPDHDRGPILPGYLPGFLWDSEHIRGEFGGETPTLRAFLSREAADAALSAAIIAWAKSQTPTEVTR